MDSEIREAPERVWVAKMFYRTSDRGSASLRETVRHSVPYVREDVHAAALSEAQATIARLEAEMKALRKRLTPRPIRYAPKDGRLLIGVERPPKEEQTFFYDIVWNEQRQQFVTPFVHALNGASHFLDPKDMIGIVWPHEIAKQRRAV